MGHGSNYECRTFLLAIKKAVIPEKSGIQFDGYKEWIPHQVRDDITAGFGFFKLKLVKGI